MVLLGGDTAAVDHYEIEKLKKDMNRHLGALLPRRRSPRRRRLYW